jgi:hypothetical protein
MLGSKKVLNKCVLNQLASKYYEQNHKDLQKLPITNEEKITKYEKLPKRE